MTIEINATDDFELLVDGLTNVELHRRESNESVSIAAARRVEATVREAVPSGGHARQADAVWHLRMPAGEGPPQLGDVVIDEDDGRWTILETQDLALLGRWRCATRELSVAYGCLDRVDVLRAVWDDLGSGPEIVDWVYALTALPVRIQPVEMALDETVDPPATESRFQIILSESIELEPDDRFVGEDGAIYLLETYERAERIDALPIAHVLRQAAS